jgi:hypothetical protein
MEIICFKNKKRVDSKGERVWFPADGKPYFDQALRRTFSNVDEKADFLAKKGTFSTGESFQSYKKEQKKIYEQKMDERRK